MKKTHIRLLNSLAESRIILQKRLEIYNQISDENKFRIKFWEITVEGLQENDYKRALYEYMDAILKASDEYEDLFHVCIEEIKQLEEFINKEVIIPEELKYMLNGMNATQIESFRTSIKNLFSTFRNKRSHPDMVDEKVRYQLSYKLLKDDDFKTILKYCDSIIFKLEESMTEEDKKEFIESDFELLISARRIIDGALNLLENYEKAEYLSKLNSEQMKKALETLRKTRIEKIVFVPSNINDKK